MRDAHGPRRGSGDGARRDDPGKTRITIRIDDAVLAWFRDHAGTVPGASYQQMINQALRDHIRHEPERIEDGIRRVVREELTNSTA
jgi:uncharacterized protein (DUF4415 family)